VQIIAIVWCFTVVASLMVILQAVPRVNSSVSEIPFVACILLRAGQLADFRLARCSLCQDVKKTFALISNRGRRDPILRVWM
jgi:hypothetical protein